jgi:hypothetical protein
MTASLFYLFIFLLFACTRYQQEVRVGTGYDDSEKDLAVSTYSSSMMNNAVLNTVCTLKDKK